MKQKITRPFLAFFGTIGTVLAGLISYQRLSLLSAKKKIDHPHEMKTWNSPEGTLAYRCAGKGKPLLCIHSMMLGASCREWDGVFDSLSQHYRVYAVDLPGFGDSFSPEKTWSAYQYAQYLHAFIETVIQRPICLCGANAGADFALILSMLHPKQVRRMILISPEGFGKGFATTEDVKQLPLLLSPVAGTQKFLFGTSKTAIKKQLSSAFYAKERISTSLIRHHVNAARSGANAQTTFAGIATRFYAADTRTAFEKLSVPFLMIWGEENTENPVEHFYDAEKKKSFGHFALFEQTASFPHIECAKGFVENVTEFLK